MSLFDALRERPDCGRHFKCAEELLAWLELAEERLLSVDEIKQVRHDS